MLTVTKLYAKILLGGRMELIIKEKPVKVIIIKKKIKNLYFRFDEDLNLVITCSHHLFDYQIKDIIKQNEMAISKLFNQVSKKNNYDQQCYLLGKRYTLVFDEKVQKVTLDEDLIITKDHKMFDQYYQRLAFQVFNQRIESLSPKFANLPEYSLKTRKMKTRWGVCNRRSKSVTLNLELLKKNEELIDYVIIHELCHFYEANHSHRFWQEVAVRCPEYKLMRKKLKEVADGNN